MTGAITVMNDNTDIDFLLSLNTPNGPLAVGLRKPDLDLVLIRNGDRTRAVVITPAELNDIAVENQI